MLFHGIRGWWLVLGLLAGAAGTVGCVGESPCHYTASCPPPEGGIEDETEEIASSDTDDSDETERTEAEADETGRSTEAEADETGDDETEESTISDTDSTERTEAGTEEARTEDDKPDLVLSPNFPTGLPLIPLPLPLDTEEEDAGAEAGALDGGEPEDACAENNGGCDPLTNCSNALEGPECGACPAGYVGSGSSGCAPALLGLGLSHGSVSPEIDPSVDVYQVVVPVFIQNLTLTPSVPVGAVLSIRGALVAPGASWTSPPLDLGLNTISILVEQAGHPSSTYTLNVTRGAEPTVYVKASNTGSGDRFGDSVALSGDGSTLAVGARHEDSDARGVGGDQNNDAAENSGAVYVFVRSGNSWVQQAYVKASNTGAGDRFGSALALSSNGNTLAVGADGEDSNATGVGGDESNDSAASSGAVYVFARSGTSWAQQAYVKASNPEVGDAFGWAVSLSGDGNVLAVGAYSKRLDEDTYPGAAYVFTRSGSAWAQQAYIRASNVEVALQFGHTVALSNDGNTLAVGCPGESSSATGTSGTGQNVEDAGEAGAVYVFTRNGNSWTQQAYIKASNTDIGDRFGIAVALSGDGNTLAVGAYFEASNATGTSGMGQEDNSADGAGAVYVFMRSGSAWTQQAYVKASNAGASDYFGEAVALSSDGNTLAVGAVGERSSATGATEGDQSNNSLYYAGAAYVFVRRGGAWTQQAYLKASYAQDNTRFGWPLSLSGDGTLLAVGAYGDSSNATGVNGTPTNFDSSNSGAVYLYR